MKKEVGFSKLNKPATSIYIGGEEEREKINKVLYVMGLSQNISQLLRVLVDEKYKKLKREIEVECAGENYKLYCKTGYSEKQFR